MTLKPLRILVVGRIRTPFWKSAAEHYSTRISRWRAFTETVVRDGDPALPILDRNALEGKGILAALTPQDIPICLDERGKNFTSRQFSVFLDEISENVSRRPCFIIGGAYGLDDTVKQAARYTLALGTLTFPHELARVVLLEQLYRAEALIRNLPYHH
ncbi:MAG: 23S rRNA (pseudouridine(1915)-N(3))-methyltransferase RlmH [Bilophila sp.]